MYDMPDPSLMLPPVVSVKDFESSLERIKQDGGRGGAHTHFEEWAGSSARRARRRRGSRIGGVEEFSFDSA